ncbi:MAG: phosphoglucosamine mutase [Leptospiraceae bacterium]|nr:phosphoglucosamine mutase [Leptospiraceae bacterium]
MISVSGIRGKIPEGLDLESCLLYTESFVEVLKPKTIVLGRDSRPSGLFLEKFISGILLSKGIDVISIGVVPTPTLKAVVNATKSSGGIMISASHNPIVWNAFKLVGKNGFFFNEEQMKVLLKISSDKTFTLPKHNPKSRYTENKSEFLSLHYESVLKRVNVNKIKKKKFHVLVDAVNGGGSEVVPEFLEKLGCKVTKLYCDPTKVFPREPEPTPHSLKKTAKFLKQSKADIGFALDPDADRLVILTPERGCISEEYTFPLSLLSVLPGKTNSAVINLSTSFVSRELLAKHNKRLLRSKVGEANVVSMMIENRSFFGGEGNGGVIDPEVNSFGRDSLSGIAHILNYLAINNTKIDRVLDGLPEIFMKKTSFPIKGKNLNELFQKFKDYYRHAIVDERDGLYLEFSDKWIHVRASNTEPIIRVIAEAKSNKQLSEIFSEIEGLLY